jgi:hypothetical protein
MIIYASMILVSAICHRKVGILSVRAVSVI